MGRYALVEPIAASQLRLVRLELHGRHKASRSSTEVGSADPLYPPDGWSDAAQSPQTDGRMPEVLLDANRMPKLDARSEVEDELTAGLSNHKVEANSSIDQFAVDVAFVANEPGAAAQRFKRDGFVCVRNQMYRAVVDNLHAHVDSELAERCSDGDERWFGRCGLSERGRWDLKLRMTPEVCATLAVLVESLEAMLTKLRPSWELVELAAMCAFPGDPGQPVHADTSHIYEVPAITVFVALHDIPGDRGPTRMYPMTHTNNDAQMGYNPLDEGSAVLCTLRPGDFVIMDSRLLHNGTANVSKLHRYLFYFTFRPPSRRYGDATCTLVEEYEEKFKLRTWREWTDPRFHQLVEPVSEDEADQLLPERAFPRDAANRYRERPEAESVASHIRGLPDVVCRAWADFNAEFDVQKKIWESLALAASGFAKLSSESSVVRAEGPLRLALEAASNLAVSDPEAASTQIQAILQRHRGEEFLSRPCEAAAWRIPAALGVRNARMDLAARCERKNCTEPCTDYKESDALMKRCQLEHSRLEYRARQVLGIGLRAALRQPAEPDLLRPSKTVRIDVDEPQFKVF